MSRDSNMDASRKKLSACDIFEMLENSYEWSEPEEASEADLMADTNRITSEIVTPNDALAENITQSDTELIGTNGSIPGISTANNTPNESQDGNLADSPYDSSSESDLEEIPPQKKRKKRDRSVDGKNENAKSKHPMRAPCHDTCTKKCNTYIPSEHRKTIHELFWKMTYNERKIWLSGKIKKKAINRKYGKTDRSKTCTLEYSFKIPPDSKDIIVCQKYFLSTLGYSNNKVVVNLFHSSKLDDRACFSPPSDKRGQHPPANKKDLSKIEGFILKYNPQVSHYRRKHAPNRRYLPSTLSVTSLFSDFKTENPGFCTYETFRKVVKSLNIGFGEPSNDMCDDCLYYKHNADGNAKLTAEWEAHKLKAKEARNAYREDEKREDWPETTKVFACDLQKVLLLPIMNNNKTAIFTPRLVTFNETFADMKSTDKHHHAVLWHEAVAGRYKEDIASSYFKIIALNRYAKDFVFWVDNCAGQNKNWCLFSMFVSLVNQILGPDSITVCYLLTGHTFMAADSIHGHMETKLRKKKVVNDFQQLKEEMTAAVKKLDVQVMDVTSFRNWPDHCVSRNTKRGSSLPLLSDVVAVKFKRGSNKLFYKTEYAATDFKSCEFVKLKAILSVPEARQLPRGVSTKKKDEILKKLVPKMSAVFHPFWENLPSNEKVPIC